MLGKPKSEGRRESCVSEKKNQEWDAAGGAKLEVAFSFYCALCVFHLLLWAIDRRHVPIPRQAHPSSGLVRFQKQTQTE